MRKRLLVIAATLALVLTVAAYGHVTISPKESTTGASEKYTFRVPNERESPTVRLEAEFPPAANVTYFEAKAGWKIEFKKDAAGKIVGAIWTGSTIGPHEYAEFSFLARNPKEETKLAWKVIQIYQDGSRSEWTGAEGSRSPAPITTVKKAATNAQVHD